MLHGLREVSFCHQMHLQKYVACSMLMNGNKAGVGEKSGTACHFQKHHHREWVFKYIRMNRGSRVEYWKRQHWAILSMFGEPCYYMSIGVNQDLQITKKKNKLILSYNPCRSSILVTQGWPYSLYNAIFFLYLLEDFLRVLRLRLDCLCW